MPAQVVAHDPEAAREIVHLRVPHFERRTERMREDQNRTGVPVDAMVDGDRRQVGPWRRAACAASARSMKTFGLPKYPDGSKSSPIAAGGRIEAIAGRAPGPSAGRWPAGHA